MMKEKILRAPIISLVVLSNIIFFLLFILVGLTRMLGLPDIVCHLALCLASWSSTFALVILFKRIYPGQNFRAYVKSKFQDKIKISVISVIVSIQVLICISIAWLAQLQSDNLDISFKISSVGMFFYFFIKELIAGPLGEELGWRGYALGELQKKHSSLIAALIVGFWWGLWHFPIWFTMGLTGLALAKYIMSFMTCIIALTVIMTVFYNLNQNLIIPIVIHQLFNFFIQIINADVTKLVSYAASLYLGVAIVLVMVNPKQVLYRRKKKVET